ncbi:hypothetical protein TSUD_205350 [Trifolium subterraneum]|uniref:Uncharacterized protein n=1 Tax=Trifolium subterraneum TaxID=3900 RepID=A0A2Z6NQ44_TRISU|nr:hypothetical protein TSUD_205350 [Trifolium subterraneum]
MGWIKFCYLQSNFIKQLVVNNKKRLKKGGKSELNGFRFSDYLCNGFGGIPENVGSNNRIDGDVGEEVQSGHCVAFCYYSDTGGFKSLRIRTESANMYPADLNNMYF